MRNSQLMGVTVLGLSLTLALGGCRGESLPGRGGNSGADGAVLSEAGFVIPGPCAYCTESVVGGQGNSFATGGTMSDLVGVDGEGALVLNAGKTSANGGRFMWVAETDLPGVVKIDLETLKIVGRYRTGGSSTSRTTVNVLGEAFVGARSAGTKTKPGVTKILPGACPDTNGDGKITTSTGPDDVLPYGQDDCVVWHTETEGDIRGLAAQDQPGTSSASVCSGKELLAPTVDERHFVWVGGDHGKIYKLDAKTGQILLTIEAPGDGCYGMALSGDGRIWTAKHLAFVDTNKCTDETTCNAAPLCTQSCNETSCPATCDGAVKARIKGISGYGITVDSSKRVWMSDGATKRYDPNAPPNKRLTLGPESGSGGIAADAKGWVWAATDDSTTVRIRADSLLGTVMQAPSKGVAVDSSGRILTVYDEGVHLIEPDATAQNHTVKKDVVTLKGFAYAYSDMTGMQTMLASNLTGWYRRSFEGCKAATTDWRVLNWDVEVPPVTWAVFRARAAADVAALASAPWQSIACVSSPGGKGSASIDTLQGNLVEIEIRFSAKPGASARIKSFGVVYSCGPDIS